MKIYINFETGKEKENETKDIRQDGEAILRMRNREKKNKIKETDLEKDLCFGPE